MTMTNGMANAVSFDHQPYSTKRHGLNITNCDSEPVQTPGCVQTHGALLVLRLKDLKILQASENVEAVLGRPVETILEAPVRTVIGVDGEHRLRAMLAARPIDCNPAYLMSLPGAHGDAAAAILLDVTAHTIDGVVILEFEATGRTNALSLDYYELVKKTVARLQRANTLLELCDLATQEIFELTGMDRVMVYKFHEDGHGEVFAESKRPELMSWIGLHYPAEDIPKPARDVFTRTWLRPIPDMANVLAEMVPLVNPDTGIALDMTYCFLRGVSRMCSEYYSNMGVTATLTMSIRRGDHLWGLISCTYSGGPKYFSYEVRATCEFLAQVVSLHHNAAEDREHLIYRLKLEGVHQQLLAHAVREGSVSALIGNTPSLLDGIDAGGAALRHNERWRCVGNTPGLAQLDGLGQWLAKVKFPAALPLLYATDCLVRDYPPAAAFVDLGSGLLALPLSPGGQDLMLWFKPETMHTVNWGGDPHDKHVVTGPNGPRLSPRTSFALFVESVRQRCLPWKPVELEAVARLRLHLVEMVVEYAQQRSLLYAELARSNDELDSFKHIARHDLKEPLRGIHQYAAQLMEDAVLVDDRDRSKLERMLRLARRMDSLLDSLLHFSHVGEPGIAHEMVDLNEVASEAMAMAGGPADGQLEWVVPRPLPTTHCNRSWCREIFVNLLSNALQYCDAARKRIEIGAIAAGEAHARPGCPPGSAGHMIYYVADNGIGIEEKYYAQIFKLFKRLHGRDEYGGGIGAGLTVVQKLVERQGGKIWLESLPGTGTTFYFTLPGERTR